MFEFELPDVGEGVAEGEIVAWHVDVGDHVEEDEVLAEVETDKAVVDLPSPVAGTVETRHAEEGDVVAVGTVVVTIDVDGEDDDTSTATGDETGDGADADATEDASAPGGRVFAPPNVRRIARELEVDITAVEGSGPGGRITERDVRDAAEGGSDDEAVTTAISNEEDADESDDGAERKSAISKVSDDEPERKSAVRKVGDSDGSETGAATADSDGETADRDRTLAAPATRRIAEEESVDLDAIPTEKTRDGEPFVEPEDVRAYAETQQAVQAAEAAAVSDTETAGDAASEGTAVEEQAATAGDVRREPYRGVRRTIGEQMEESAYTAPHVTHHDTAVVDALVETRADLKPRAEQRGIKLTYLPFVMKAVVAGLREFPVLNSALDEDSEEVVYKQFYNVGVATATEAGLMVPVVENVDQKGILQLASETAELAERARQQDLAREEMQGGTFSITNFGAIGGEYATPIINYPETAILGLGSIEQRPVVADGEATEAPRKTSGETASTGGVVAAHTLPLSLSIDHRVVDGAEAARFVNTVIDYLENPQLLLLE